MNFILAGAYLLYNTWKRGRYHKTLKEIYNQVDEIFEDFPSTTTVEDELAAAMNDDVFQEDNEEEDQVGQKLIEDIVKTMEEIVN